MRTQKCCRGLLITQSSSNSKATCCVLLFSMNVTCARHVMLLSEWPGSVCMPLKLSSSCLVKVSWLTPINISTPSNSISTALGENPVNCKENAKGSNDCIILLSTDSLMLPCEFLMKHGSWLKLQETVCDER